ncbi:hypothetical protein Psi02_34930 [Planotetraspora silvatica]|uniref:Uncharacterized protein n=2 Tax=Planotetraspora silvatica TaxID=234614 RepID=A0A8J3URI0_9ACTN|nr:hypothetical protein Psi02_34930 [Planotetraspora silvatica]
MALGAMAMMFALTLPAHAQTRAGGWATTELDPLPDKLVPGKAYTIGYWVLQHGTHPFDVAGNELGSTGLRLTGADGKTLDFLGTALSEPAHYAVTIKVPAGEWRVQGVQGIFMPYDIGTMNIPGGLTLAPPQFVIGVGTEVVDYWGSIKPPGFPWDGTVTSSQPPAPPATVAQPADAPQQPVTAPAAPTAPKTAATASGGGGWSSPYLLVVTAVLAVGATLLVQRVVQARVQPGQTETGSREGAAEEAADAISIGRE